jgi:hypothetical protein
VLAMDVSTENAIFYICVTVIIVVWLIRNAYIATHRHKGPQNYDRTHEWEWEMTTKETKNDPDSN